MRIPRQKLFHHTLKTRLEIGIDKDAIKIARRVAVLEFGRRIAQPCLQGRFGFRSAAPQTVFQGLLRRGCNKHVMRIEFALFHVPDPLDVNVQDANFGILLDGFDGLDTTTTTTIVLLLMLLWVVVHVGMDE